MFLQSELAKYNKDIEKVILFDIDANIVVERMVNRQVCKACGTIFNKKFNKSKQEGICDACGGTLENRIDDKEDTIRHRITIYNESCGELLAFYKPTLVIVDASQSESEISKTITQIL
jgi:adenylate kinase